MKQVQWDKQKNAKLREERGIDFEIIQSGEIVRIVSHPNKRKYPNQKVMYVLYHSNIYLVPFVEDEEKVFLKTIIPSRKATKEFRASNTL